MGALVHDPSVPQAQTVLNSRFAPGDPLKEMVALQRSSAFFQQYSLASVSKLLNISPSDPKDRRGWFKFCDHLKNIPSDRKNENAHDRIIEALRENSRSKSPLPCWFTWHPGTKLDVSKGAD